MAFKLANRAFVLTATTGTGSISLGSVVAGYQSFSAAGITDGDTVRYTIEDGTNWEIGTGTLSNSVGTMARSVIDSSGGGSALTLSGNAKVFLTAAADDILVEVVDDTTPQLGGNLDVQAREITTSTSNGNVKITPNGSGVVEVKGAGGNDGTLQLNCSANSHGVKIKSPPHSAGATYTLTLPNDDGTSGQSLTTNGSGVLSFTTISTDPTRGTLTKSFTSGETASITLSAAVSPTPVVSATKEIPQAGVSSKGAWDVASNGVNYDRLNSAYNTTLTPSTAYPINQSTYSGNSKGVYNQNAPSSVLFKPDGTKLYTLGYSTMDAASEYSVSTAWDVSTANNTYNMSLGSQDNSPMGMSFNSDGTRFFMMGGQNKRVYQYSLSTAYQLNSASLASGSKLVSSQASAPNGVTFNNANTRMYITCYNNRYIYQYDLSTANDVSTASYNNVSLNVVNQDSEPREARFNADGTKLYLIGSNSDSVHQYSLTTAFDLSTASYDSVSFSVASQESAPNGLFFKPDNTKFYIVGTIQDTVYEYDVPSADVLSLGTGSFASTDIGKTIAGNGGAVVLTAADGSYVTTTAFTDSSTIAAGSWSMHAAVINATNGLEMSNGVLGAFGIANIPTNIVPEYIDLSSHLSGYIYSENSLVFKPDGLKVFFMARSGSPMRVFSFTLTTAFDASTIQTGSAAYYQFTGSTHRGEGLSFKSDGTRFYYDDYTSQRFVQVPLTTPWDLSTAGTEQNFSTNDYFEYGFVVSNDGTKVYAADGNQYIYSYDFGTAWDITTLTNKQQNTTVLASTPFNNLTLNADDTKLYFLDSNRYMREYTFGTKGDISTLTLTQSSPRFYYALSNFSSSLLSGLAFNSTGTRFAVINEASIIYTFDVGTVVSGTGYVPSITNGGGQIDSQYWTDINSMTTDEIAGAGAVHYAVSTDNHTTWSVIKEGSGVRSIVRNNSGTWQYNSAISFVNAWNISTASFLQNFSVSQQSNSPRTVFFKPDGTKMYVVGTNTETVNEYNLSTAWDVLTAVYSQNFNLAGHPQASPLAMGIFFKPDGTKMYIVEMNDIQVNEYNLSTAWSVSTASYSQNFDVSTQEDFPEGVFFKPDGSKMYIVGSWRDEVNEYNLSTAWDISTAVYNQDFDVSSQDNAPKGIFFKPDGSKMYIVGIQYDKVYEYNLSTAWDISTAVYNQDFDVSSEETSPQGVFFKPDGAKMYVVGAVGSDVNEYNVGAEGYTTSATWANSTTNSELYALQQALTDISINRMDKTQLQAVTDPNHYTLGNSLDLMISLYLASASSNVPSSDGVSINYDAATINQGAILGTDYNYDFPSSTTVRVTSSATQNLKIRVV